MIYVYNEQGVEYVIGRSIDKTVDDLEMYLECYIETRDAPRHEFVNIGKELELMREDTMRVFGLGYEHTFEYNLRQYIMNNK